MSEPIDAALPAADVHDASAGAPGDSFWGAVREGLRGSHRDYTQGPVGRAVLVLAIPMVLEMVMESVFAVVDVFFVARLGADAVAAVGLTESMLSIVYTLAMGLAIGVTATVARRTGEHDAEGAAHAAGQGLVLGLGVAIVVGITGVALAPRLLAVLGGSPDVVATGGGFVRVMLGGNATILLLFLVNAIFRGSGDATLAMRTLWLANLLNIALDPCFIFGLGPFPELGVTGAAVATTIGRGVGVLYGVLQLTRPDRRIRLHLPQLRPSAAVMAQLARLSATGTLQVLIGAASWIGLVRIVAAFGSEALAGYTIAIRIVLFAIFPAWGLSNAAATMVGQALGARDPGRAERAVWMAGGYNMLFLGTVSVVFVLAAAPIIALFTPDAAVRAYAVTGLRIMGGSLAAYAYGMVVAQAFNGAGDTWTPTVLNLLSFWLLQIPLAYGLGRHTSLGMTGVYVAVALAFSVYALLAVIEFRRGRWRAVRV